MNIIKEYKYRGYWIVISGRYHESGHEPITIDGKTYTNCVDTRCRIYSSYEGGNYSKIVWERVYEYHDTVEQICYGKNRYENFIAQHRLKTVRTGLFKKENHHISIKEDLERIVLELQKACESTVDNNIEIKERRKREDEISSGLIDSLEGL